VWLVGVVLIVVAWKYELSASVNAVLQSFIAGFVFWVLAVQIPQCIRRTVVRRNCLWHYESLRKNITKILCRAAMVRECQDRRFEVLSKKDEFRQLFSAKTQDGDLFCDALNGLIANADLLHDIVFEFDMFVRTVSPAVWQSEFLDEKALLDFQFLDRRMHELTNLSVYVHDKVKYIGDFIWCIMCAADHDKGYLKVDWIEECLKRV